MRDWGNLYVSTVRHTSHCGSPADDRGSRTFPPPLRMREASQSPSEPEPPRARAVPQLSFLHGERRVDDYAYFREKDNPEVMRYIEAENAYTAAMTRHSEALREQLYTEMLARIKEDDSQVPARRDGWFYYSRMEKGRAYPIFCRKRGSLDAVEEVYFDQNDAAKDHEYYQLGGLDVSPDHRYLALLVDTNGYEDFELQVRDLETGLVLPDGIGKLGFGLAWAGDSRTVFYVTADQAKRGDRVWRHTLSAAHSSDVCVHEDADVLCNVGVSRSRSGDFIFLTSSSFTSGETWVLDALEPGSKPRLVAARAKDVEYAVTHGEEWFYILTNRDGARNFKVMRAPVSEPGLWEEWLPHRPDAFVEGIDVFKGFVVVEERHSGLRRLRVTNVGTNDSHDVTFPEPAYGVFLAANPEYDTTLLRFTYSSLVTPKSVFDYDMVKRSPELKKRDEVLGGYDPSAYRIERLMVTARDGAAVPVSLVYRTPFMRDGERPLLLYAYGSYGATIEPTFSSQRFSLVDRGFVYAIAHVRGGQEMGRQWYDDGKMMKKMNTFHDFIDVAEFLVKERFTSADRLAASGASAGGLLMGAIVNMRPELFRAVVADVPFVDVINTMLDASIPLTASEWEQWGNPQVEAEYACMRAYSPYDNVERKGYPRMLVTSGVNDPRVAFWEPVKWVAKLRALKTDGNTLLLKMEMGAGHGGPTGRYEQLRETAFRYAFILNQTTSAPPPPQ